MNKITSAIPYTLLALLSILVFSCGSETKEVQENTKDVTATETIATEKNWEEFTVKAIGNTMPEMKYDLTNISVNEGSWVRIKLVNEGIDASMLHNIVFVNYGTRKAVATECVAAGPDKKFISNSSDIIAASGLADPGQTVVLEFKAPSKGNYEFMCTYPGHSGIMRGYFFVK